MKKYLTETDYNHKIKAFIASWEEDSDKQRKSFKTALTGLLVPYIYKIIREEKLSEKEIKRRKYFFFRLKNIKEVIIHFAWYVLWSIKWLLFISLKNGGRRIILTSFFLKNVTSFEYIRAILNRNITDQYYLVNFSVIYKMEFLFNRRIFCYPHFFYRKKEIHKENYYSLEEELKVLFKKCFQIDFRYSLFRYIKSFNSIYNSFSYLVKMIQEDNKILCFIQDCDYLNDRVLFSYYCQVKKIPTIAFDHSIQIYDHLFFNNFSDYRITWGEYQINRLKRISSNIPQKLIIGGRPNYFYTFKKINYKKNRIWLYLLPAFQDAHMQTIYRSLKNTDDNISKIKNIISENFPDIKLLIKPHPSDKKEIFQFKTELNNSLIDKIIEKSQLVFIEDSTVSLEILKYEIPVIYFTDKNDNDNLHIRNFNIDYVLSIGDDLESKINEALHIKIYPEKRERMFKYYFGDCFNFDNNLNGLLNEIFTRK